LKAQGRVGDPDYDYLNYYRIKNAGKANPDYQQKQMGWLVFAVLKLQYLIVKKFSICRPEAVRAGCWLVWTVLYSSPVWWCCYGVTPGSAIRIPEIDYAGNAKNKALFLDLNGTLVWIAFLFVH